MGNWVAKLFYGSTKREGINGSAQGRIYARAMPQIPGSAPGSARVASRIEEGSDDDSGSSSSSTESCSNTTANASGTTTVSVDGGEGSLACNDTNKKKKNNKKHQQLVVLKNPTWHNIHEKYWIDHSREVGRGGWGVVRVCIDLDSGEELACKSMVKAKLVQNDEDVECLRREIAILYHLQNCPNVVTIKGAFEDDDQIHIVMELLKGNSLLHPFHERTLLGLTLTEEEASNLTRAIVQVIQVYLINKSIYTH
ncbi:unnamed protein product [Cuscuta epithymum]|uniref:Protein kinase domain-containing protein n=1 Tax=Cuscuta epithymum TaxID=186058 RepID=A0AAV0CAY3_9ASTE|nr:unnamed protein product [Cuscuta epithymum]